MESVGYMKAEVKGFWDRKKSAKKPQKKEKPPAAKKEEPTKKKDDTVVAEGPEKRKPSRNRRAKEKLLESVTKADPIEAEAKKEEKPA